MLMLLSLGAYYTIKNIAKWDNFIFLFL